MGLKMPVSRLSFIALHNLPPKNKYINLLLDYSNQGHLTKFSTNLMKKIVNIYSSFPTNNPCNQAVHLKDNRFLVILDNFLENHC